MKPDADDCLRFINRMLSKIDQDDSESTAICNEIKWIIEKGTFTCRAERKLALPWVDQVCSMIIDSCWIHIVDTKGFRQYVSMCDPMFPTVTKRIWKERAMDIFMRELRVAMPVQDVMVFDTKGEVESHNDVDELLLPDDL